ncbi:MFS transporter [Aneurinibacillus migulanus]|uniref:MFS transporter n=1 Tax=Aneurinibacillus migulanus TaxID=47500 RepID=A0A0D1V3V7_ANEMI|nr:MFS transporter [Aneurinibacillus migulanus]KIV54044.1 MFS transporter [Aneurinibacillus migulanus]KON97714.1 MFS transporter [Aneurinibacillus migulanus]MED0896664.1 MFS transporter [Aneurinibacillus migulanus]MED1619868.1 MFS transporter [Aneurinibacillus migulanus]SDK59182.1 Predicted arabinose efflux permease, MFS family [Aneurinibacillus migulanus]
MIKMKNEIIGKKNYSLMTAILCWTGIVVMSSLYVTIPLISLFADTFEITSTQAAVPGSIFSLSFAIGCLLYGALSDKYGRKKIILIGLISLTLISLLLGFVDSLSWLIVLRGIQGAAAATFSPVALAYAVEMFPTERRVTTIGFISTGFLIAGIMGQVISAMISQYYGWNMVFYIFSAIYAGTFLLVFWFLPNGEIPKSHTNILTPIRQMGKIFTQKDLALGYLVSFVLLMSFVSMYTVLGNYLSGPAFNLTPKNILYVRFAGIFGMLLSPFAGRLAKKFGVRQILRGGLLLSVISLTLLGLISNLPVLIIVSVLFVSGIALAVPVLITLIGQLGGESRGIAVSLYTFILFTGTSFAPILSVCLIQTGSYLLTFILLSLVLSIGLVAALLIRRETVVVSKLETSTKQ